MSFTEYYFNLGYNLEKQAMEKTAGRTAATLAGAVPGPFGTIASAGASEDGRGTSTAVGQALGALGGGVTGAGLGYALPIIAHYLGYEGLKDAADQYGYVGATSALGGLAGAMGGGSLGAYIGHGEDNKAKK